MKRNHILLPISVNQLDAAQHSLDQALDMVAEGGKITVLNAQEPLPGAAKHYLPKDAIKTRNEDIHNTLTKFVGDAPECAVVLVSGRAGVAILEYANANNVDCIVIASHRPELKDYLLGSTASRVVRHARCSVYVLR